MKHTSWRAVAATTGVGMAALTLAAACSAGSTGAGGGGSNKPSDSKDVSLVLGVKGSPFYQALQCGAQSEASKLGLKLSVSAPDEFSASSQVPVVNSVVAKRPGAAVVVPTDTRALITPLQQLAQADVRVITADQTVDDTSMLATQVLTDNEKGGRMAADAMATLLDGKGKVLTITQPPGSAAQDARAKGFRDELKKYGGITDIGEQYQSDDPSKAAQIVTSTLAAHSDLAGVFSTNDQGAIGAVTGLQQANAAGRVKVVAYDAATAEVNALKNGTIQALVAQNPKAEGAAAMQAAADALAGKKLPAVTQTEIQLIKAGDNAKADQYEYKADC